MKKTGRSGNGKADLINDFLASTHVFAAAVADEIEDTLLKQAGGKDVTASQIKLLKLVSMSESQTISGVASFLGVSNAAASKAVDRLVRRDLLNRTERKSDRRFMHLSLTDAGRQILASYEAARRDKLLEMFGDFAGEDLERASALLDRLSVRIAENASNAGEVCLKCGIYFHRDCLLRKFEGRRCLYVQLKAGEKTA